MAVEIRIEGTEKVNRILEHYQKPFSRALMARVGRIVELGIKQRTAQGKDYAGKPFAPYSDRWAKARREAGRPTGHVDLFFKGRMMGALTHKTEGDEKVMIFFADAQQAAKAHGHHFGYAPKGLPKRPFFHVSGKDLERIIAEVDRSLGHE